MYNVTEPEFDQILSVAAVRAEAIGWLGVCGGIFIAFLIACLSALPKDDRIAELFIMATALSGAGSLFFLIRAFRVGTAATKLVKRIKEEDLSTRLEG